MYAEKWSWIPLTPKGKAKPKLTQIRYAKDAKQMLSFYEKRESEALALGFTIRREEHDIL